MNEKEKNRLNAKRYRDTRMAKGWVSFYRIIPADLANELCQDVLYDDGKGIFKKG